jgi:glycosyltransferase involved in cell wall biosynthesis
MDNINILYKIILILFLILNENISSKNNYHFKYYNYTTNIISYYKLYKNNYIKSKNPDVSVIISLNNRDKYINSTITSVQNQRMKNIEIIIVDEYYNDYSIKYIEYTKKIDPRIILIKNGKNIGDLYSKLIGSLYSKGKYILFLDSDDMICIEDFIQSLYKEAKKGNYDYIEVNEYIEINSQDKTIIQKKFNSMLLWAKLIKKKCLYKEIINRIGKDALNKGKTTLLYYFILLFFNDNQNFKRINKIGIFHYKNYNSHISTYILRS